MEKLFGWARHAFDHPITTVAGVLPTAVAIAEWYFAHRTASRIEMAYALTMVVIGAASNDPQKKESP